MPLQQIDPPGHLMADMSAKPLLIACGLLVGLAGCGGSQPNYAGSRPASPSSAPPGATSTALAPAVAAAPATCRKLPVVHDNPSLPAGFLDVVSGQFTPDPSGRLTAVGSDLEQTGGTPALVGWPVGWPAFAAGGRWVPAAPEWISPDGTRYLYPSHSQPAIHLVDVRSAADRIVSSGSLIYPVQWTEDVVYVMDWPTGNQVTVYALSLTDGHLRPVGARLSSVVPIHAGGAWLTEVAPGVLARNGQNGPMANRLSRIDMETGGKVAWFSAPNAYLTLLGFATDGMPLLLAHSDGGSQLIRVAAPGRVGEAYPADIVPTAVTDQNGTWLIQPDGTVLLFRPGSAPVRMGRGEAGLKPAGVCAG